MNILVLDGLDDVLQKHSKRIFQMFPKLITIKLNILTGIILFWY